MGGSGAGKRMMGVGAHVMRVVHLRTIRRHQTVGQGGGREFQLCSDASESASCTTRLRWSVPGWGVLGQPAWGGAPSQSRDAVGRIAK